jgi:hypothetical protein
VVAAEGGTEGAQGGALRLVLSALRGSPAHALLGAGGAPWDGEGDPLEAVDAVRVLPTGDEHALRHWRDAPLALAALLVQEDFILLRSATRARTCLLRAPRAFRSPRWACAASAAT